MNKPKEKKRLIVEMTPKTHKSIKETAKLHNITMRKWVMRIIIQALKKELHY